MRRRRAPLRAALPHADLLLLNYYNAAAIFGSTDPFNIINEIFDSGQTALIDSLASPFNARVVDIHTPFEGHETELTFVLSGGVHPNDKGYAVIADQMTPLRCQNRARFRWLGPRLSPSSSANFSNGTRESAGAAIEVI